MQHEKKPLFQIQNIEDLFQVEGFPKNNFEVIPFIIEKLLKIERITTENCSFQNLMSYVSDVMSNNKIMSILEGITETTDILVRDNFASLLKIYSKIEGVTTIGKADEVIKTIGKIENVLAIHKPNYFCLIEQGPNEFENLSKCLIENCLQAIDSSLPMSPTVSAILSSDCTANDSLTMIKSGLVCTHIGGERSDVDISDQMQIESEMKDSLVLRLETDLVAFDSCQALFQIEKDQNSKVWILCFHFSLNPLRFCLTKETDTIRAEKLGKTSILE